MSRYRLLPSPAQQVVLRDHCALARFVWILSQGWGLLVRRLQDKAPGRIEKVKPHFTSQRCSMCGHVDPRSRESQARFVCTACHFAGNADVNAARNIAAGHAVTARGGNGTARPMNREPQLLLHSA